MQHPPKRLLYLCLALSASLGASAWTYWRENDAASVAGAIEDPIRHSESVVNMNSSPDEEQALIQRHLGRVMNEVPIIDLFEVKNWNEPSSMPQLPSQPQILPPPVAPPLPFQYIGKTEVAGEHGNILIHLIKENIVYSVRPGENIDENYKLEKIEENILQIVYLPLATNQGLFIGNKE